MPISVTTFSASPSGQVGNPNVQVIPHGLGETPKAVIIFGDGGTTAGAWSTDVRRSFGMYDGTDQRAVGMYSKNGVGSSVEKRYLDNAAVISLPGATLTDYVSAVVTSVDATNVRLQWSTATPPADIFGMKVIGGPSVQAEIVTDTMKTTAGTQANTAVGFKPDALVVAHAGDVVITENTLTSDGKLGIGVVGTDLSEAAMHIASNDAVATTGTGCRAVVTACVLSCTAAGAFKSSAAISSFDTLGYTLSWPSGAATAAPMYVLALKGVKAKMVLFSKKNGLGTQALTGAGFPPQSAMFFGHSGNVATTFVNAVMNLGIASPGGAFSTSSQNRDSQATTQAQRYGNAKAYTVAATTASIQGEADVSAWGSDGVTLNWTTSDTTTANFLGFFLRVPDWGAALADLAAASDALARATASVRSMADTAGASDSVARSTTSARALSETAPASDAVARQTATGRPVADNAIASDSVARQASVGRGVTDSAASSDAISRQAGFSRPLADSASAVDALGQQVGRTASPADTATASDSLTRSVAAARALSDLAAAGDALASQTGLARALTDGAGATDTLARSVALSRTMDDDAPASPDVVAVVGIARDLSDDAAAMDALDRAVALNRTITDTAPAVAALATSGMTASRSLADPAPSSDSLVASAGIVRALSDAAPSSDSLVSGRSFLRALGDVAAAVANLARRLSLTRLLNDLAPAVASLASSRVPHIRPPGRVVVTSEGGDADVEDGADGVDVTSAAGSALAGAEGRAAVSGGSTRVSVS